GQVQPSSNDPRARLPGGNGNFTRLAFEVSFKTPVAKMRDQPIYVTANYRYYDELNASDAVKQAHLAAFNFLQATIGPQRGLFASYSTGRLPFDVKADQLYELGFHTSLN
ncbi:MAG TPA: hypothetical protein VET48_12570, partial [Steroidobacteraceae bacterium]|nr:hypothetical protein [Steroidobacteraceae bacterium]